MAPAGHERVNDILEDANEHLACARYNGKMLEHLYLQMSKIYRACRNAQHPDESQRARMLAWKDATTQNAMKVEGEDRPQQEDAEWQRLENELKNGAALIKQHTASPELGSLQTINAVHSRVQEICINLSRFGKVLAANRRLSPSLETIDAVVDVWRVESDRLYMFHYLGTIIETSQNGRKSGGSKEGTAIQSEWNELKAYQKARKQQIRWISDNDAEALRDETEIGSGGCGIVWRAQWNALDVAVKRFVDKNGRRPGREGLASLFTDSEFQRSMESPHVVRIFAASQSGFVIMELAKHNMSHLQTAELSWPRKGEILLEAAHGLKAVHDQGAVHTGVKSQNFLLFGDSVDDFRVKISDVGLRNVKTELTCKNIGQNVASGLWMAPEVCLGSIPDVRSDVFGFGLVMAEVLSQRGIYNGSRSENLLFGWKARGQDPCCLPSNCPAFMVHLIRRCISPDPYQRPNMVDIICALEKLSTYSQRKVAHRSSRFTIVEKSETPAILGTKSGASGSPRIPAVLLQTHPKLTLTTSGSSGSPTIAAATPQVPVREGFFEGMFVDESIAEETQSEHADSSTSGDCLGHQPTWASLQTDIICAISRAAPKTTVQMMRLVTRHWCASLYSSVQAIDVPKAVFDGLGSQWITRLEKFPQLQSLKLPVMDDLDHVDPGADSASTFLLRPAGALSPLKHLLRLDLRCNDVEDWHLAKLEVLTNLRSLNLAHTRVTNAGLRSLSSFVALEDLDLGSTAVDDAGVRHILQLSSLASLDVGFSGIRFRGAQELGKLRSLRSLGLGGIELCGRRVAPVAPLTNLRSLSLVLASTFDDYGVQMLSALTALEALNLGLTRVGDEGAGHLSALTSLTSVDLRGTDVGDRGVRALSRLTNLTSLHLGDTRVSDRALVHLAALTKLERVILSGSWVTGFAVGKLSTLPNLRILALG